MKQKRFICLIFIVIFTLQVDAQVKVKGYYRKDGTYVRPHYRSNPDGNPYNNWSFPGNTNPYTGKTANGNPDTYLRNYYNRTSSSQTYSYPSNNSYTNYSNSSYSTHYVTAKFLNVRSGPSADHNVIDTLSFATTISVIDSYSNGWKKIQYSYFDINSYSLKTRYGYVSGNYLSMSNPNSNFSNKFSNNYNTQVNSNKVLFQMPVGWNWNIDASAGLKQNRNQRDSIINSENNSNIYSTINKVSSPYGRGNGRITIWTNCGTDGDIKVFLNDVYLGTLTQHYTNGVPSCGESGTLFIDKPAGNYKFEAKGNQNIWSGTITITEDKCLIQGLEK
jgi:hypothetical protein